MIASVLCVVAVVVAYLLGSIPFGLLLGRAVAGIDIRAVGSGNIGATNVGRTLGFRWFAVVFALDFAKGLLPTLVLPWLLEKLGHPGPSWLAVVVALASILGHNFPVYLRFKGGKGVATSLGAVVALDPIAGLVAAIGFVVFLLLTKYVSMSSVLGGVVFAVVYFEKTANPWNTTHQAMSTLTIALLIMLGFRHRHNFVRIARGTEPKVLFGKQRPPRGKIHVQLLLVLTSIGSAGLLLAWYVSRTEDVVIGSYRFHEIARAATGHQRADRLTFALEGKILAVNCPRYNRVVIYDVAQAGALLKRKDFALDGRPVAILATSDYLLVLQRPSLDHRHLGPGWFDTFDFNGTLVQPRCFVGYDPDDFALLPGERKLLVLHSGNAEGETNRPDPDLTIVDLQDRQPIADCPHVTFDRSGDDPDRIRLADDGRSAVVTFRHADELATLDLTNLSRPSLVARAHFNDRTPLAENPERETRQLAPGIVLQTLPDDSGMRVYGTAEGVVPLFGPLKLSNVRPNGLAVSPERNLIAIAGKAGSVHLIAATPLAPTGEITTGSEQVYAEPVAISRVSRE